MGIMRILKKSVLSSDAVYGAPKLVSTFRVNYDLVPVEPQNVITRMKLCKRSAQFYDLKTEPIGI